MKKFLVNTKIKVWAYVIIGIILKKQNELPFIKTSAVERLFLVES